MSKRAQAVSNEEIIAALLSAGCMKDAASAAGLPVRTLYDRMNNAEFQTLYRSARAEVLRAAVHNLNGHIQEAITTIADVMSDQDNNAAVRLQAAQTLLNTASKYSQRLQAEESGIKYDQSTSALFEF